MLLRSATCLTLLLSIWAVCAQAQNERPQFKFGAKAGINFSTFTDDIDLMDRPDQRYTGFSDIPRMSILLGVTADRQLSQRIMFGAELLYNSRGTKYREENTNIAPWFDDDGDEQRSYNYITYRFDYMELPLTIGYNFLPEKSNTILSAYTGIAPGLLINHKRKIDYDKNATDLQDQKLDMRYGKSVITNLLLGLKVMESKERLGAAFFDLRGSYTLSPVFTRNYSDAGRNLDTRMFTLSLAVGVRF
ncbi:porin family protein [Mucilaginibacter myungsuensis]|uniref:PorT family protein n=1 Tax=Mucilaginibacter myungsuensis TaxID=649104 RepID=A0A929KWW0_9SPHI|nr:porin family protein [Mucilaginibacter myungsuensis]MBE9662667.1 PorT family protein [Mucilaginibacter myungsuensis]MDN3598087.1 porin family protein [Mucilaginibacter myungsuensis]